MWLTLFYRACERPNSWEHLQRDFFRLLTESISVFTLSGHLSVNILPDLRFFCLLVKVIYWPCGLKCVYLMINLAFLGIIVKLPALVQFWMILSPNKKWRKIFFPFLSKTFSLRINSNYCILCSNLKQKKKNTLILVVISSHMGFM